MNKRFAIAVVLVVAACSGKDDSSGGAKPTADKPGAKPPPAMPARPPASDVVMSCDRLVPKSIVDKYLGGLELTRHAQHRTHLDCQFQRKDPMSIINFGFECKDKVYDSMAATIDMMTDTKSSKVAAKKLDGIGKGAVSLDPGNVNFWASNVHCMINIVAVGDASVAKDAVPLAKDLDAALSPAALQ